MTDLPRSTVFMVDDEGLKHRTAWAGKGDGVLFFDVGGDGQIKETREYVFTEWDPTARSDFEALRARFDSNSDGRLTNADAAFSKFKVMVTNPDGTQTAQTLTQLGITSIDLTGDVTDIRLPDGSVITGQSTFTMGGVQRTAADVTLMAEAQGYDVTDTWVETSTTRTTTYVAKESDGDIAFRIVSVALRDGSRTTNSYDDNGDMTFGRTQRITIAVDGRRWFARGRQRNSCKRIVMRGNPLDGITQALTDSDNAPVGVAGGVRGERGLDAGVSGVRLEVIMLCWCRRGRRLWVQVVNKSARRCLSEKLPGAAVAPLSFRFAKPDDSVSTRTILAITRSGGQSDGRAASRPYSAPIILRCMVW